MESRIQIGSIPLGKALDPFLSAYETTVEKIRAVQTVLESAAGKYWRDELGKWTTRMVPVELLVPEAHHRWRPLVHEAMQFVVSRLSPSRLAPKIVEQMGLPADTPPEVRLLRFIAKVPGLQKIGQVLARNSNLDPRLRRALIKLENGISDMGIDEIRAIIGIELKTEIDTYAIKIQTTILSEASVSAVVGFTWRNPESGRRERGVFKVLKPHIPGCYAEDMKILRQLTQHLARKHAAEGTHLGGLAETLTEIRLLLEREVDFRREQTTLANFLGGYRSIKGVRVPRLIPLLSTNTITALSFERGRKITEVRVRPAKRGVRIAERLAEALLAVPSFTRDKESIFHADPHAGNLLYDKRHDELVILDWALTERLTREQRRNVVLMVLMLMLRDPDGVASAVERLCQLRTKEKTKETRIIRRHVDRLLDELPLTDLPGPMHAMLLLDEIALDGLRFPAALLMFRKAFFTLEGVVEDIAGARVRLDSVMARYSLAHWKDAVASFLWLLSVRDWMAVEWSALTFTSRVCARALFHPWYWLPGLLPKPDAA
jgi:ubiquinone biosynthesis protein